MVEVWARFKLAQTLLSELLGAEGAVEVEGGADEREVREGLREIAKGLALRAGLFGVEAEVIGVAQHAFESRRASSSHAGLARPARVSASTSQKEHMLKVPSSPGRPSTRGCGG